MYKEIIVCILVVILIFSMDLLSNNYTKKVFFSINDSLGNLRNEMLKEDKDVNKINDEITKVEQEWNSKLNLLSCYIEHNELEKVARQLTLIKGNIDVEEYNQAVPQLDDCVYVINHIKDKEIYFRDLSKDLRIFSATGIWGRSLNPDFFAVKLLTFTLK